MAVTRERLEEGMSFEQFMAQMTKNKERFQEYYENVPISPAALDTFKRLARPLDVLVIAEDWCGDVINNMPTLGKIAKQSGKLNLHVFLRDQNLDIMNQYLNQGKFMSIPVFVFFDEDMREVGRFIERPAAVTELNNASRQRILDEHPELNKPADQLTDEQKTRLQQVLGEARTKNYPRSQEIVVNELVDAIKGAS